MFQGAGGNFCMLLFNSSIFFYTGIKCKDNSILRMLAKRLEVFFFIKITLQKQRVDFFQLVLNYWNGKKGEKLSVKAQTII